MIASAQVLQYVVDSIAYGSLFALMALALSLLFGVMGLMNFAFGELIMVGAYVMYYTRPWGVVPMIVLTIAGVVVLSVVLELVAFRPVRHASPMTLLATSFAVSYALQQLAFMTVGQGLNKGLEPYPWTTAQHELLGVRFSNLQLVTIVVVLALLAGLTAVMRRTTLGMQLRASTEDVTMAQLVGVRPNRVISSAFAITGLLAGAVTILYVMGSGSVSPDMGQGPLLIAFVGVVIGGLGSLGSAAFGGFILGFMLNLLQSALPTSVNRYTEVLAFLFVIAILVLRPDGLMGAARDLRRRLRSPAPPVTADVARPEASA
jgi:branched-chain amino acid transport system permease protein